MTERMTSFELEALADATERLATERGEDPWTSYGSDTLRCWARHRRTQEEMAALVAVTIGDSFSPYEPLDFHRMARAVVDTFIVSERGEKKVG